MELFPPLPYEDWRETKETLHRFAQTVGKVRLAASTRRNHWWNVPFHLTGRGLTTRPMGLDDQGRFFCIDFDFVDHRLLVAAGDGRQASFSLPGLSVAGFYDSLGSALAELGFSPGVKNPRPYDLPDADRPFSEDEEHCAYSPEKVNRYWVVLSQVNLVLEEYAAQWSGKTSPVHHYWHTFDIAVTRFGSASIAHPASVDAVTREAYSREVVSVGFWFGDAAFPEPAFYSYVAPEPASIEHHPLRPGAASWITRDNGGHLAILRYDDIRTSSAPHADVLAFLDSAFRAGASSADWDLAREACPGGVTDTVRQGRG
ncbi:DUF5996 family protein [Streptomyces sp. NPDC086010]|uniref:DUF5996 family protein n=1 Tax=Streptomyces sp. NPDC086010 TaxID=3365745 RepID=UPI0037D63E1F